MINDHRREHSEYLDGREKLPWTGQPKSGMVFRSADIFLIPFSLLWCGFAICGIIMAFQGSLAFVMCGIPFAIKDCFSFSAGVSLTPNNEKTQLVALPKIE